MADRPGKNERKAGAEMLALSSIGFTLIICTALGLAAGVWLDRKLGTKPLFIIVFVLLGTVAGFVRVMKDSMGMDKTNGKHDK